MANFELINKLSVGLFFLFTMVTLQLISYSAFYLGRRSKTKAITAPNDFISTNIIGLLALILGFSFSMAIERYETRRVLSVKEANAIGTAYLRSQAIKFKNHAQVRDLFKHYTDLRIEAYQSLNPRPVLAKNELIQDELWKSFLGVTDKNRGELESAYMHALNEMFDTGFERTMAFAKMMPVTFYILIYILAGAAFAFMNFDRGYKEGSEHIRAALFVVLFSILFSFIYDMDHFKSGVIQIKQDALLHMRKSIR